MRSFFIFLIFAIACAYAVEYCGLNRDCDSYANSAIDPSRYIPQEEFHARLCCIRQAMKAPTVVFGHPALVGLSSSRDSALVSGVFNPYKTASLIAIAGNRVMLSASGSWDFLSGNQVPDGVERVNYAYANMYKVRSL